MALACLHEVEPLILSSQDLGSAISAAKESLVRTPVDQLVRVRVRVRVKVRVGLALTLTLTLTRSTSSCGACSTRLGLGLGSP